MEGTIGEIRMFAGNFAPRGWALCNGQLLAINSNTALFSVIGTYYGGDGRTTMGLPDLRGRTAIGTGQHPGSGYNFRLGQIGGAETHALNILEMPSHNHSATFTGTPTVSNTSISIPTVGDEAQEPEPSSNSSFAIGSVDGNEVNLFSTDTPDSNLKPFTAASTNTAAGTINVLNQGGNLPFSIIQPFNTIQYIICMVGTYPSRS